jgi:hypothetical protein
LEDGVTERPERGSDVDEDEPGRGLRREANGLAHGPVGGFGAVGPDDVQGILLARHAEIVGNGPPRAKQPGGRIRLSP